MMTAIALDDEPLALQVLHTFCDRLETLDLRAAYTEPGAALKALEDSPVDLLFLDIRMPTVSGIEFSKSVPAETMVIFTTAHSEYAVEGFNVAAIDYLLKPFSYDRFLQAIERAAQRHTLRTAAGSPTAEQFLHIRADYSMIKLALADIRYIEGLDNYLKIHLRDARPIVARMSMKGMMEKLGGGAFVRVHRSYIVPISEVERLRSRTVRLKDGTELPVGAVYAEDVAKMFGEAPLR